MRLSAHARENRKSSPVQECFSIQSNTGFERTAARSSTMTAELATVFKLSYPPGTTAGRRDKNDSQRLPTKQMRLTAKTLKTFKRPRCSMLKMGSYRCGQTRHRTCFSWRLRIRSIKKAPLEARTSETLNFCSTTRTTSV